MSCIKVVQLQIYVLICLACLLIDLCLQHLMLLTILTGIVPPFALEVDIQWREKGNELSNWVRDLAIISLHCCTSESLVALVCTVWFIESCHMTDLVELSMLTKTLTTVYKADMSVVWVTLSSHKVEVVAGHDTVA